MLARYLYVFAVSSSCLLARVLPLGLALSWIPLFQIIPSYSSRTIDVDRQETEPRLIDGYFYQILILIQYSSMHSVNFAFVSFSVHKYLHCIAVSG